MAECEGLALVTLAKTENDQVNKGELARVATGWIHMMNVSHVVTDCGWRIRWGRSRESHVMEPFVLYLDLDIQSSVSVPNLLVGAANVDMGAETALDTKLCLSLIHNLKLCCKAWKTIVDKNVKYNALRLAQYEYAMCPNEVKWVYLPREHNLIRQFQLNLMWFSHSRHVSSKILRRILMSDLRYLSLRKLVALRDELEISFCVVEFYGMIFHSIYPY